MTHLRQERLTREAKMARERAQLEGAHEVRYRERAFHPRHHVSLDEVRAAVDALQVERKALPQPAPPPAPPAPLPPSIDPARAAALAPVVPGPLVAVASRYRTGEGEVVEAAWEQDGARRSGLFLLEGGAARPVDDVASRIDSLPEPARPAPMEAPPAMPAPVEEASAPAEAPKKKGFGLKLGKGKDASPAPPAAGTPAEPRKKGFGLKLGRDKTPPAPAAPEETTAPAEPAGEKPAKKRFGFGKK